MGNLTPHWGYAQLFRLFRRKRFIFFRNCRYRSQGEKLGITYENRRVLFDVIAKRYQDYIALYRDLNGGSTEGLAPFDEFYWHLTYYSKYANRTPAENRR